MFHLRKSDATDGPCAIDIWCRAVDDSHDFLSPADRQAIEQEVRSFLPQVPLNLAVDTASGQTAAFMFLHGGHLEALFVHPHFKDRGAGGLLVRHALAAHPMLTVDVNEQNMQARRFYEHQGFQPIGRSDLDGQGRNYPIIHMRYMG